MNRRKDEAPRDAKHPCVAIRIHTKSALRVPCHAQQPDIWTDCLSVRFIRAAVASSTLKHYL